MENILYVKGLKKSYGSLTAVKDLNLVIKKGSIFGLLGHNGAGKTTTIECILGLKRPDAGLIQILGQDFNKVKDRIGVQFQTSFYPERITVLEMVEMMAVLYKDKADYMKMLEDFGLGHKLKAQVAKLSGGERQKLSVLLALINKPEIVFLDELTTGLDPHGRREVWSILKGLRDQGLTIFLTSHYMDEVTELCDEIMLMKAGQVVAAGQTGKVVAASGQSNLESAYLHYMEVN